MRTFRLATPDDIPALVQLTVDANQPDVRLPDLVFVAEQDGRLIAAVGIELGQPGMVVVCGAIVHPDFYRKPFLAFRLQEFMEDWLIKQGCYAYVCSVTKRNTRMQRWIEKLGARRYTKKHGAYWYIRTFGPKANALSERVA
jgi:RimJ/RimL family protein N-acetyltransferase